MFREIPVIQGSFNEWENMTILQIRIKKTGHFLVHIFRMHDLTIFSAAISFPRIALALPNAFYLAVQVFNPRTSQNKDL